MLGPRCRSEFSPLGVDQAPACGPDCEELAAQVLAAGLRMGTWPSQRGPNSVRNLGPNNDHLAMQCQATNP
jgi:hypothetical protein